MRSRGVALLGAAVAASAYAVPAAAPAPTVPATDPGDVVALTGRTDAGGPGIAIGEPRMRLALDDNNGQLLMRPARGVVLADQATSITTWDLTTGKSVHELAPVRDAYPDVDVRFAVTHDAEWLASGGSAMKARLFRWPYSKLDGEMPCNAPRAFSADGKLLECGNVTPEIWDVAQRKSLGKAPAAIEHPGTLSQLALTTNAWEPIARATVAGTLPVRPPAAPWATRLASGPAGAVVAAEARSDECQPELRVWTASGGGRTLAMICMRHFEQPDPGWVLGGGRAAAVSTDSATLYDPATGARGAVFPLSARRVPKSEVHAAYESAALSLDGGYLALGWRALGHARARFCSGTATRAAHPAWVRDDLGSLFAILATHQVFPCVAARIGLADVAAAHRRVEAGHLDGKMVICP